MPDTKMSDMIDAHSGFFQSVTSIHAVAEDLTVSDKHIFELPVFPFHISQICPIRKKSLSCILGVGRWIKLHNMAISQF